MRGGRLCTWLAAGHHGHQNAGVNIVRVGEIRQEIAVAGNACALRRQTARKSIERASDLTIGSGPRVIVEHKHAPIREATVTRSWQGKLVCFGIVSIRSREHAQGELEVGRRARHWADNGDRRFATISAGRRVSARRDQGPARLVSIHATKGCGYTDRSSDVGAELKRHHARRKRCRAAAGRAAGRARQVPRI